MTQGGVSPIVYPPVVEIGSSDQIYPDSASLTKGPSIHLLPFIPGPYFSSPLLLIFPSLRLLQLPVPEHYYTIYFLVAVQNGLLLDVPSAVSRAFVFQRLTERLRNDEIYQ